MKEQDTKIDEEDEKSAKITNAVDLGITFLRLRCSAAILLGNIYMRFKLSKGYIADWGLFQIGFLVDICLFWSTVLMLMCRNCRLCCRLGCCRYYLWCCLVIAIGAVVMELPMVFAFQRMDPSWCKMNLTFWNDDNAAERASKIYSASMNNATTMRTLISTRKY